MQVILFQSTSAHDLALHTFAFAIGESALIAPFMECDFGIYEMFGA